MPNLPRIELIIMYRLCEKILYQLLFSFMSVLSTSNQYVSVIGNYFLIYQVVGRWGQAQQHQC